MKTRKEKKKQGKDIEISDSGRLVSRTRDKKKDKRSIEITDSGRIVSGDGKVKKKGKKKLEVTNSGRVIQNEERKKRRKLEVTKSMRIVPEDPDKSKNKLKITDSGRIVAKDKDAGIDQRRLEITDSLRIVPADFDKKRHQLKITGSGRIVPKFQKGKEIEITNSGRIIRKYKGGKHEFDKLGQDGKIKKPGLLTTAIAAHYDRDTLIRVTFRDTLIHLAFIILASIGTLGTRESKMYYLTEALKNQFFERPFIASNGQAIKFDEIRSIANMWHYVESIMLDSFYSEFYSDPYISISATKEDDKKIMFENKLLGVPRIRQVRVTSDSCKIHEFFERMFSKCYSEFSSADEDTAPFGLGTEPAWVYSDGDITQSYSYTGHVGSYDSGGYYQDLTLIKNNTRVMLNTLKMKLWITRATRAVFVDFSVYNPNYNYFTICKIVFELPATGGVIPSHRFRTLRLLQFLTSWDYFVFICNVLSILFIFVIIFMKLRELTFFKIKCFFMIWTIIDGIIIGLTLLMVFDFLAIYTYLEDGIKLLEENPSNYGNLEYFDVTHARLYNASAVRLFFIYIKIFHYFNFSRTMTQLNNTISKCAVDIIGFTIMFFIVFTGFSMLGFLLFGGQVRDFRSFGMTMFTLLRTVLGEFDYQSIENANNILAPMFFFTYIFFVFFILLNMFLAIINDTYADVKNEISISPDQKHLTDVIKEFFDNLFGKGKNRCGVPVVEKSDFALTLGKIREALLKCGFKDVEIEMFFQRFNIDPLSTVGEYDVNMLVRQIGQPLGKQESDKFVKVNDLNAHDEKLIQIEITISHLINKVGTLIEQLNSVDSAPEHVTFKDQSIDTISDSIDLSADDSLDTNTSQRRKDD